MCLEGQVMQYALRQHLYCQVIAFIDSGCFGALNFFAHMIPAKILSMKYLWPFVLFTS